MSFSLVRVRHCNIIYFIQSIVWTLPLQYKYTLQQQSFVLWLSVLTLTAPVDLFQLHTYSKLFNFLIDMPKMHFLQV